MKIKRHIMLTGFPGFWGTWVVKALLQDEDHIHITALVHPQFVKTAENKIKTFNPDARERIRIIKGDMSQFHFGLPDKSYENLLQNINEIMHIAALYRLSIPETLAIKVNVIGTRNVLVLARDVPDLRLLSHISSIVVAGRREGVILENELHHHAGFFNHYEYSKYLSEVLVKNFADVIPTIIFRPGVIVGDSHSGEIPKYDGPYYTIRTYERLKHLPPWLLPSFGNYSYTPFNMVPVDFVTRAMLYICKQKQALGQTFHLIDPDPMTAFELFKLIRTKIIGDQSGWNIPRWMIKQLRLLPAELLKNLGFPKSGAAYLDHQAIYDTKNTTTILKNTGIQCPVVSDYLDTMINYVKANPDIPLSI